MRIALRTILAKASSAVLLYWKRALLLALCVCVAAVVSGCAQSSENSQNSTQASSQESYELSENHKIIFDTDTAADDAIALIMAAKASNVAIEGVTVLAGNVTLEQGCKNALMSLEVAGREDVPVYAGSSTKLSGEEIVPFSVFGSDGMGDQGLIHPSKVAAGQDGVDFIIETVKANPGEIEIVATGPLTDVAKAIQKDPEAMKGVKRVWSMGTGGANHVGDATPVAEFNAVQDAEAYECVMQSGIPVTVVGYDVCTLQGVSIGEAELGALAQTGACGEFISQASRSYVSALADSDGYARLCDPVTVAALIWDDFVTEQKLCHAKVITDDSAARGLVVFYRQGKFYDMVGNFDRYDITVVSDLNDEPYLSNVCRLIS